MTPAAASPARRFAIQFIETYRARVSLRLGRGKCRFSPTCSQYTFDAYVAHGFWKATAKSVWRIVRCNPWNHSPALDPP